MKKATKVLSVALAGCAALAAAGCGGGNSDPTVLTYAVWGSTEELEIINQVIDGFEALYADEGYEVNLRVYSNDYYSNIDLSYAGKNEADVFWMQGGTIEGYIREGLLLNLQPYIEADYDDGISFTENDLWSVNDGYRYNEATDSVGSGDLYAIIKDWSPDFAMVYNKDLIDQFDNETGNYPAAKKQAAQEKLAALDTEAYPQYAEYKNLQVVGRTLAEIVGYPTDGSGKYPSEYVPMSWKQSELMCFLLTTYNSTGIREINGTILDNDALKFAQMQVEMNGEKLYSADGKSFNYSTAGTQSQALLEGYQHFINYQYGPLASTGVFGTQSVSSDSGFPNGDVAVVWYGRWKFAKSTWQSINFGLAPPPTKNGGEDTDGDGKDDTNSVYCSSVAVGYAVSARTKKADLAWKFIRYCMTVGTRTTLSKGFNLPGNKTIALSDAFLGVSNARENKLNNWYAWLAENTHPFTFTKYVDNSVPDGYLKAYLSEAAKGSRSVAEALRQAGNKINEEIATSLI